MNVKTVLVALIVVLAGCSGGTGTDTTSDQPSTEVVTTQPETTPEDTTDRHTTTTKPTETARTTSTTVPTTEAPPSNPWRTNSIVVAVDHWNQSTTPQRYVDSVRNATEYWNNQYNQYSVFEDVRFTLDVNASDPDVQVRIVESVNSCGGKYKETYIGCADTYDADDTARIPSEVEIEAGFTPHSTNQTVRHEFGHLLGLEHGDEPMPLMAAESETVPLSEPNATERDYPWLSQDISVAITGSPSDQQRDQIAAALDYVQSGADGYFEETTPSFAMTENASTADIVIDAANNEWACGQEYEGGSCASIYGYNEDADDALEYYSRAEITLAGTRADTTAWHVAYWLVVGFGATEEEIPDPIDGEDDDPASEWWE